MDEWPVEYKSWAQRKTIVNEILRVNDFLQYILDALAIKRCIVWVCSMYCILKLLRAFFLVKVLQINFYSKFGLFYSFVWFVSWLVHFWFAHQWKRKKNERNVSSKYMKQKYRNKLGLMKINIVVRCIVFKSVRFVTLRPKVKKTVKYNECSSSAKKHWTGNLEFISRPWWPMGQNKEKKNKQTNKSKHTHRRKHFTFDIATAISDRAGRSNQKKSFPRMAWKLPLCFPLLCGCGLLCSWHRPLLCEVRGMLAIDGVARIGHPISVHGLVGWTIDVTLVLSVHANGTMCPPTLSPLKWIASDDDDGDDGPNCHSHHSYTYCHSLC